MTRKDASLRLHVSERYIDRMIKKGKLHAIHIGKLVRIDGDQIEKILIEGSSL